MGAGCIPSACTIPICACALLKKRMCNTWRRRDGGACILLMMISVPIGTAVIVRENARENDVDGGLGGRPSVAFFIHVTMYLQRINL